jgi:hypothetical protein
MGNGGCPCVKKTAIPLFLLGAVLALLIFGGISGKEPLVLDKMSVLMTAGGVQVEGYYLEGWALLRESGEPAEVWEKKKIGEKLGLVDASKRSIPTGWGDRLQIECVDRDCQARVMVQKMKGISEDNLTYISIKYTVAGSTQESLSQEKKIRESLASLGKDHGIYLAVKGKIAADLDEEAQLAWGEAVFRDFGARITDTLRTDKYTSITGYSPVLPDIIAVGGKKTNINLSMVRKDRGTQVLLGTPLITCEY